MHASTTAIDRCTGANMMRFKSRVGSLGASASDHPSCRNKVRDTYSTPVMFYLRAPWGSVNGANL